MNRIWPYIVLIGLGVAYAVLFWQRPDLDLVLHSHLYDGTFYLKDAPWAQFFYHLIPWITRLVVVGGLIILAVVGVRDRTVNRASLFVLLSLVIGPGLLVNAVFKDEWGRARPSQIIEFGGTKEFTPPLHIAKQCESNCSFVSGHASIGFFLAAFALLLTGYARIAAYSAAVCFGLWIGFIRMAMGGHFFSDVIYSGIVSLLVVYLMYDLVYRTRWKNLFKQK